MDTTYWSECAWPCPICLEDYDADNAEMPPGNLELIDSRNLDIDTQDVWGEPDKDAFDFDMWMAKRATEPAVRCYDCGAVFDVEFEPRELQSASSLTPSTSTESR